LAGIIPGLICALVFVLTIYTWCRIRPDLGPRGKKYTWKERFNALPGVIGVVIVFFVVIGGIMMGYFSPSEAASVGTIAVLILVILKKELSLKDFMKSALQSTLLGCMVLTLIAGATVLGHAFAVTRLPFLLADWFISLQIHGYFLVLLICLVYLVGGQFIEDAAFFILATPIFFPIIKQLGLDPVWFGIVASTTLMIGIILPPMAVMVFVVSGISKVPLGEVYKGVYPFLFGLVFCNLLFLFVPQLSLWLPSLFFK